MKKFLAIALVSVFALTGCGKKESAKTIENLKEAIKGETTASAKYAAFAKKANEDGILIIANLFDAASKAEAIHAKNHSAVLLELGIKMEAFTPAFEVKSTTENLEAAIKGETEEVENMYPQFLKDAQEDKLANAERSFTWAFNTEKKHIELYKKVLAAFNANTFGEIPVGYAVCPACGNTYDAAKMDASCAFCGTTSDQFITN